MSLDREIVPPLFGLFVVWSAGVVVKAGMVAYGWVELEENGCGLDVLAHDLLGLTNIMR